jgi:hypothetical protein
MGYAPDTPKTLAYNCHWSGLPRLYQVVRDTPNSFHGCALVILFASNSARGCAMYVRIVRADTPNFKPISLAVFFRFIGLIAPIFKPHFFHCCFPSSFGLKS